MELNHEFLIETFYSYCKRPIHKRYQNVYNSECPVCKEGKSAGRSRRLFYFPNKQYFYCHNCCQSWRPFEWIKEVTGWGYLEIVKKNEEKIGFASPKNNDSVVKVVSPNVVSELPENPIDLTNESQLKFYNDNKFVKLALEYCNERRLFAAVNSCDKFYLSLDDKVHKNRLVIPFFGNQGKVICYQTRALTTNQFPKYLTKFGEKELFGLSKIDCQIPYVFIFEGPIDSMFVKNGVAIASLSPTEHQLQQLTNLIGYEQIWVFDNDKNNKQTAKKITTHIENGKKVFVWPKELCKFKDFNEICCNLEINEIPWKFVVKNSCQGIEAKIKYKLALASNGGPTNS